jgi:hypothetical protein
MEKNIALPGIEPVATQTELKSAEHVIRDLLVHTERRSPGPYSGGSSSYPSADVPLTGLSTVVCMLPATLSSLDVCNVRKLENAVKYFFFVIPFNCSLY